MINNDKFFKVSVPIASGSKIKHIFYVPAAHVHHSIFMIIQFSNIPITNFIQNVQRWSCLMMTVDKKFFIYTNNLYTVCTSTSLSVTW